MWNPAISSFKKKEFDEMVSAEWFSLDWSVWDHELVEDGDRFYMVRVGDGDTGIVMAGTIDSEPFEDEDWSGKGRRTFYVDLNIDTILNPELVPYISTQQLMEALPGFDWTGGHSGRVLSDEMAVKLDELWFDYLYRNSDVFDNEKAQTFELMNQMKIENLPLVEAVKSKCRSVCEVCGYDYSKVWGDGCELANDFFLFGPAKGAALAVRDFWKHVHCICDSCNRLPPERLRERLGEPP